MSDNFSHYGPIGILLLMAVLFGVGNVVISTILGPRCQGKIKGMAYESGVNPFGNTPPNPEDITLSPIFTSASIGTNFILHRF